MMEKLDTPITERRRQTRNSIYQCLYNAKDPQSKQEIAQVLSLSLPTVHQNIGELVHAGLIQHGGMQRSTGGRRAVGYTITQGARYAIGVSITDDRLRFLAADLQLQELAYKKTAEIEMRRVPDLGLLLAQELETFIDENKLERHNLLGVGLALPGVIDEEKKQITFAPTLRMTNISIDGLTAHLRYPTYVENDGTSGGYAEYFLQPEKTSMAYLSLENGVGGAVLLNGAPYFGMHHRSGEFGHMSVEPGGLACACGKNGCLECYCSAKRISTDLGITLENFFEGLEQHNRDYEALWQDLLQHLAIGINNIRMALDCDVVLGGFLSQYMTAFLPELRRRTAALNTFEDNADYIDLCLYPRRAVMLGVALHFIREFIETI